MVLAEFFPQLSVFTKHVQSWGHLTQSNNVPAIREPVQDVIQHMEREITKCKSIVDLLEIRVEDF